MSTLIRNGLIGDGTGAEPVVGDLLIRGNRIVRIGKLGEVRADEYVEAEGGLVTPGFVEVNTESDHYLSLLNEPAQEALLRGGVTTIIGGSGGVSLAPISSGSLAPLREWTTLSATNIGWRTMDEFLEFLERRGLGINFGTLVGFSTIRRSLTGETFRDLTHVEIGSLCHTFQRALDAGAFGLSIGGGYAHTGRVPHRELHELVRLAASRKRICATHLRDIGGDIVAMVRSVLALARNFQANVNINHLQPIRGHEGAYGETLSLIEKEAGATYVHFDACPSEQLVLPLYALLPVWAQDGGVARMAHHVASRHLTERFRDHFANVVERDITLGRIADPSLRALEGKKVDDYARERKLPLADALLNLMCLTGLRAMVVCRCVDMTMLDAYLTHPQSMVSMGNIQIGAGRPCDGTVWGYGSFGAFLMRMVERNLLPIGRAIMKVSSLPARKYGIANRGLLREGYFADVTISHKYVPTDVFVNGIRVVSEGKIKPTLAGMVLRSSAIGG